MDWKQRVWGYSGATGMVQGFAAGYFLWDLLTSARDINIHGPGALAHAASALAVSSLGFVSAHSLAAPSNYIVLDESLTESSDLLSTITV